MAEPADFCEELRADAYALGSNHPYTRDLLHRAASEIEWLRRLAVDAKADAYRLHRDKMRLFEALMEIRCDDQLTGAEAMAIATRAVDEWRATISAERSPVVNSPE